MGTNKESEERRAVHIAAIIMVRGGLCRYDSLEKCRKYEPSEHDCTKCIEKWLMNKAKKELRK